MRRTEEILRLKPDNEQAAIALLWVLQQQQAVTKEVTYGTRGFVVKEADKCPRCKLGVEETARDIEEKREMREALFREVEEILVEGRNWGQKSR